MEHKRVVISGIGMVTSHGIGKEQVFSSIVKGTNRIQPIPDSFSGYYQFKSRFYVPFPEFTLSTYGIASKYGKRMQDEDRTALLCALLAIKDAGFPVEKRDTRFAVKELSHSGILLGTGFSGLQTAFHSYCAHVCKEKAVHQYSRIVIPLMMPNSVSAWVSIFFHIKGGAVTMNASCASGTTAIGRAFRLIQNGHYTSILAGGVECLKESTGAIMRGFDVLGALTKSADGSPRPFSKQRSGFLFSEGGGCIIVLEELEHALKRGAPVYAEVVDYRENSDAYSIIQIDPDPVQIIQLLHDLKGERNIDYINTHGTATISNDSAEAKAITSVFGKKEEQPIISATKGILGHTIGASGAIETAITALSINRNIIHASGVEDPLDINLAQHTMNKGITFALSVSYGFGGHNAGIVLKKFHHSKEVKGRRIDNG